MNQRHVRIKRALISVSDKTDLISFAVQLVALDVRIISTGGTSKALKAANIPFQEVSDITQFPEMMDGRLKTLHPNIHGGILGLRDQHEEVALQHQIEWIDLIVVNLYPFEEAIKAENCSFEHALENIDIGGPTMIRAAAKNMGWASVVVDPKDYSSVITELQHLKSLSFATRRKLATKAFSYTAYYDSLIHHYLETDTFPERYTIPFKKFGGLRYGENPHQEASAYQNGMETTGILQANQLQGKQLSYNNIADSDAAWTCLKEFDQPACVIVKHATPCGVAAGDSIHQAFDSAFAADKQSAFGGIIALNESCDNILAEKLLSLFIEVLIAPHYTQEALTLLSAKPNIRILQMKPLHTAKKEYKFIDGGLLMQHKNLHVVNQQALKVVTITQPTDLHWHSMLFAWKVLKHIKSNAILIARDQQTLGVGAGQVSRVDAVNIALKKAPDLQDMILASDAFFPFRDSIDLIAQSGNRIRAIIQPGGSIKDEEVISACNEHGISMVFTGLRCFKH